jgi:hypothetical protein
VQFRPCVRDGILSCMSRERTHEFIAYPDAATTMRGPAQYCYNACLPEIKGKTCEKNLRCADMELDDADLGGECPG